MIGPADQSRELDRLVELWGQGDAPAGEELFKRLMPLIKKIARGRLLRNGQLLSIESMDLASEASLKLLQLPSKPSGHQHMIRLLAKIMRASCIDLARERQTQKRTGKKVSLSLVGPDVDKAIDLLALDQALTHLTHRDELAGRITELRFFGGLSESEVADNLKISRATASRKWQFARLFLARHLDA